MPENYIPNDIRTQAQDEQKLSLGSFAKNFAIGALTFMATEAAINVGSRFLVKRAASSLLKSGINLGKIAKHAANSPAPGVGKTIASKLGLNISHAGKQYVMPSIGEMFGTSLYASAFKGKFGKGVSDYVKYEKALRNTQGADIGTWMSKAARYFSPATKDTSTFSRFIGGLAVKGARTASELPGIYAIDRTFGRFYGYHEMENAPPISDIKGTAKHFGQYALRTFPAFMAFKSAGVGISAAKYGGIKFLKKNDIGKTFFRMGARGLADANLKMTAAGSMIKDLVAPRFKNTNEAFHAFRQTNSLSSSITRGLGVAIKDTFKNVYESGRSLSNKQNWQTYINEVKRNSYDDVTKEHLDFNKRIWENVNKGARTTYQRRKVRDSAVNIARKASDEIQNTRARNQSMFSYIMQDEVVARRDNVRFNLADVNDKVIQRLSSQRNLTPAQSSELASARNFAGMYRKLGRKGQLTSGRVSNLDLDFNLSGYMNQNGYYFDMEKTGARHIKNNIVSAMEQVSINVPFSNFNIITGKELNDLDIRPFKWLGISALKDRTPNMTTVRQGGNILWASNDTSALTKSVEHIGGYVRGRPFNIVQKGASYVMDWAPHNQRYRRISDSFVNRTVRQIVNAKEQSARNKATYKQNIQSVWSSHIVKRAQEKGLELNTELLNNKDTLNELVTINDNSMSSFLMRQRLRLEEFKYNKELGAYGSGSYTFGGRVADTFTKFFDKASNYNYFNKRIGKGKSVEVSLNELKGQLARGDKLDSIQMYSIINEAMDYSRRAQKIAKNSMHQMLYKTDISDIKNQIDNVALSDPDAKYINNFRSLLDDPNRIETFLNDKIKINRQRVFNNLNSSDREMVENSLRYIQDANGNREKLTKSMVEKTFYGRKMSQLEYVQKATMMVENIDSIVNNNMESITTKVFDAVSRTETSAAFNVSKKIGGKNPFRMFHDFREVERRHNSFFSSKNQLFNFDGRDLDDVINEKGITSIQQAYKTAQEFVRDAQFDLPEQLTKYSDDLEIASKIANNIFSSRAYEKSKPLVTSLRPINERLGGNMWMLESAAMDEFNDYTRSQLTQKGMMNVTSYHMLNRLNSVANWVGFGINTKTKDSAGDIMKTWALKRAAPVLGLMAGWNVLDKALDVANIGAFDEGLNVFAGEQVIKYQHMTSQIRDHLGITDEAKHLEGLMPGFVDSPGAKFLRTGGFAFGGALIGTMLGNPAIGATIGIGAAAAQDFGLTDLARSVEENEDIWSGRKKVPIRTGARWMLNKTFFSGDRISGFAPHWFARLKSQAKYTNTLYGSPAEALMYAPLPFLGFNPVGQLLDPYHYERVNARNRPYLYSAGIGEELPFVGPLISGSIGELIKPTKIMGGGSVQNELGLLESGQGNADFIAEQKRLETWATSSMLTSDTGSKLAESGMGDVIAAPRSPQATMDKFMTKGIYNPLGLYGWAAKGLAQNTLGKKSFFEPDQIMSAADEMLGVNRSYWDEDMGDLLLVNEFIRRMVPKDKAGYNPLKNTMSWLPGGDYYINFREGDPYTKIKHAEYRLPGAGYETLNPIKRTFPLGASSAGADPHTMAMRMTGMEGPSGEELAESAEAGTKIHKMVQDAYMARGLIKQSEKFVYDPITNMHGYVDMLGKYGGIIEVKTVESVAELENITKPKSHHQAQVNVYMNALDEDFASIMYVPRDDPSQSKTFNIGRNKRKYFDTVRNVAKARQIAASVPDDTLKPGAGYSHLDRMKVLADVAPFSKMYFKEKEVLDELARMGTLNGEEYQDYLESVKMAEAQMRPLDTYPNRFLGKITSPDEVYGVDDINMKAKQRSDDLRRGKLNDLDYKTIQQGMNAEYNMYNLNMSIKDASAYSVIERGAGAMWEAAMGVQLPYVSRKFMQYWTPVQAYRRNILQGSRDSFWDNPYQSFVEPAGQQMMAATNPVAGAVQGAFIGGFAGPVGFGVGAIAGGLYGSVRGGLEQMGMSPYIKSDIAKARDVEQHFDHMIASSTMAEYNRTGNMEALQKYKQTTEGSEENPFFGTFGSLPQTEKAYVSLIASGNNVKQIQELRKFLPEESRERLDQMMGKSMISNVAGTTSDEPTLDWNIINDDDLLDKMKFRLLENSSVNAYVSGLGWKNQLIKWEDENSNVNLQNPLARESYGAPFTEISIKSVIYGILRELSASGMVNTTNDGDPNSITVEIG